MRHYKINPAKSREEISAQIGRIFDMATLLKERWKKREKEAKRNGELEKSFEYFKIWLEFSCRGPKALHISNPKIFKK